MVGLAAAVDGGSAANAAGAAAAMATSRTVTVRNIGSSSLRVMDVGVTSIGLRSLRCVAVRKRTLIAALTQKGNSLISGRVVSPESRRRIDDGQRDQAGTIQAKPE